MAILSACDFLPWAVFFWLATQAAYAMAAIPFAAAFGERVPDKFRDRADSWHGKGLALGQLVGVAVAVALTPHAGGEGWDGTTGFAMLVFAGWLVVAAVVTLLVLPFEGASSYLPRRDVEKGDFFSQYRPPQNAPKFSVAFAARMFAVAATAGIAVYQWYLAPNIVGNTDEAGLFGIAGAGSVVVVMAICTFVGALIAALLLGRIVSLFGDLRIPAVASAVLFMVAALLPLLMDDGFPGGCAVRPACRLRIRGVRWRQPKLGSLRCCRMCVPWADRLPLIVWPIRSARYWASLPAPR